jgi:hypothetical protein
MIQREPRPLVAHIHVPKCAGTSVRLLFDELFPGGHLHLYFKPGTTRSLPTTFVYENSQIAELVAPSSVSAFSSHNVRRFPSSSAGRPIHYVTFLRDPVQQFLSYLKFTRRIFAHIDEPILLSHLPPNLPDLSLREAARWLLQNDSSGFINFRENYTTNFLAREHVKTRYGFDYDDWRYRGIRQVVARNILRQFLFVGLTERMDESMSLLRRKMASLGIAVPSLPMRRDNVSEPLQEDVSWINKGDQVGSQLLNSLREDRRLYRWVSRRFLNQLQQSRSTGRAQRSCDPRFTGFSSHPSAPIPEP